MLYAPAFFYAALHLLVFYSVEENVHHTGGFIGEFNENIAAILVMEGD